MKRPLIAALAALLLLALAPAAAQAETIRVSATLILASNDGEKIDSQLGSYVGNLKRMFKYSSYQMRGRGQAGVSVPGKGNVSIGSGYTLAIEAEPASSGRYRIRVDWSNGGRLIDTTLTLSKGSPTILGGPSVRSGDGDLILILVVQ